jgi:hypothetical protein
MLTERCIQKPARYGAIRSSAAIWSRCGRPRSRRAIRRQHRGRVNDSLVCNLYSITTNQVAVIALFRVINRYAPIPGVFPDYPAPVIRNAEAGREMTLMRWGMPPPSRTDGPPVTNICNTSSPRCMVEAGTPMPCPGQQLRRIRARAEPRDQEEGRRSPSRCRGHIRSTAS